MTLSSRGARRSQRPLRPLSTSLAAGCDIEQVFDSYQVGPNLTLSHPCAILTLSRSGVRPQRNRTKVASPARAPPVRRSAGFSRDNINSWGVFARPNSYSPEALAKGGAWRPSRHPGREKGGAEAPQFSVDVRTFSARQGFPAGVARSIELQFVASVPAIEVNVLVLAPTSVAVVATEVEPIQ